MNGQTIIDRLRGHARKRPDALAFEVEGEECTFGSLEKRADSFSLALTATGLRRGGRCALALPTSLPLIELIFATQIAGGTPIVMNPETPPDLMMRRLARLDCDLVIFDSVPEPMLDEAGDRPGFMTPDDLSRAVGANGSRRDPGPDDIAFMQLTSGTTGEPKAAMILQRNLVAYLDSTRTMHGDDEVFVGWIPLYHDLGIVLFVMKSVSTGRPCHLVRPGIRTLPRWLKRVEEVGGTITGAPDFVYRIAAERLNGSELDLSSLRIATNGGEPVKAETMARFEAQFNCPGALRPGYGMAETTLGVCSRPVGDPGRLGPDGGCDSGKAHPGVEIRVIGPDGSTLEQGETGEIVIRGEQVFAGYFRDPEATRRILVDGWLHTGDLGTVDSDGYVFVLGRKRAMIKRAGSTIAPREIEEAVDLVDGVRGSAAVGLPSLSSMGSDRIVVVAEISEEVNEEQMVSFITEEVRRSVGLIPDEVRVTKGRSIPRTANGKIRYDELREALTGEQ